MSHQRGGSRPGAGRPKGSPGAKTVAVMEKLQNLECDPIEALAMISKDPANTPELRFQANKELAQYVAPKRKAVELDSMAGGINVNLVKFSEQEEKE
tara:strand:+ start:590 stop:880 length:291 start_codon:yes stop_codon:yes gene_type:complete